MSKPLRSVLFALCATLLVPNLGIAQETVDSTMPSTDVEKTMKTMSLKYKQAMKSTEANAMLTQINDLQQLVASVQLVKFEKKRNAILQQGLSEVQTQLGIVHSSLVANDIIAAKSQLKKVATLRKRYHKERSPDIWQLIFGSE
jgi:soluble cytochrome b562